MANNNFKYSPRLINLKALTISLHRNMPNILLHVICRLTGFYHKLTGECRARKQLDRLIKAT